MEYSDEQFLAFIEAAAIGQQVPISAQYARRLFALAGAELRDAGGTMGVLIPVSQAVSLLEAARARMLAEPTRQDVIATLRRLQDRFYWMCFHAKVGAHAHPFLEFNGLMAKYIDVLERSGADPHLASIHGGEPLKVEDHDIEYLVDKLECIFAPMLAANPNAAKIFEEKLLCPR